MTSLLPSPRQNCACDVNRTRLLNNTAVVTSTDCPLVRRSFQLFRFNLLSSRLPLLIHTVTNTVTKRFTPISCLSAENSTAQALNAYRGTKFTNGTLTRTTASLSAPCCHALTLLQRQLAHDRGPRSLSLLPRTNPALSLSQQRTHPPPAFALEQTDW